ncbi:MAG: lipoate--protein ligase family protein [Treponema sp.]|jgi:lipoate-protein ligase A|nr:lipoate--protein ligase family protein [Treponema sp.]
MTFPFRLLNTGYHTCFYNLGLDDALLEGVIRGASPPVLRFYGWNPPAVSVGYFQGLEEEVDLAACAERGVDVIRRVTGGGAVFHNRELTYSMVMPATHPLAGESILDSYRILCRGILRGFALLGLDAEFAPINDIICGGKKISGNAQTRRQGALLQHGTILLQNDVEFMFSLLKTPQEKLKGRHIQDVKERVTSLQDQGLTVDFDKAAQVFAQGFQEALDLEWIETSFLRAEEEDRAREAALAFSRSEWLYKR